MTQQECFICTGDLIPNDSELHLPKTPPLRAMQDEWTTTTAIRCSQVIIRLEGPVDYMDTNPLAVRDLVARQAQHTAQMWLSIIGFVEGASYSTRISTIEDSNGYIRRLGPKPKFGVHGENLEIENAKKTAKIVADLSITNVHFRRALHDYGTALDFTLDSPFYLYRALDILRKHYGHDNKTNWEKMHRALGTKKVDIDKLITPYANAIRHGESLGEQELLDSYLGHYKALKYVRDALLIFLIQNSESDLNLKLPDLSRTINFQP